MTIQEVMLRIEIPEEVRENIGKYSLSEKEFYEWKHLFENDFEIFLNKGTKYDIQNNKRNS